MTGSSSADWSRLTIGVPVFNEARHIRETLNSILDASEEETTILVSDNGSTDDTVNIVKEIARDHPRIQLYRNDGESHTSNFRNLVLRGKTEWFCWVGGHDVIVPDFLEKALIYLQQNPETVWVYGKTLVLNAETGEGESVENADSDVDTGNLRDDEILQKLLQASSGMFVYGVFRREKMFDCPLSGGWAADRCAIAYACFRGGVHWLPEVSIFRRMQRDDEGGESAEEREDRYRKWGLLEFEEVNLEPRYYFRLKLFRIFLAEVGGRHGFGNIKKCYETLFRRRRGERFVRVIRDLSKIVKVEPSFPQRNETRSET